MAEKLLEMKELRIALVGPGGPFKTPPAPAMIRGWIPMGLKYHRLPGGKRRHFLLSEVMDFLSKHTEVVG